MRKVTRARIRSRDMVGRLLPQNRPPTHPGEMVLEEFLKPLGISQSEFAIRLGASFARLNGIIRVWRETQPNQGTHPTAPQDGRRRVMLDSLARPMSNRSEDQHN